MVSNELAEATMLGCRYVWQRLPAADRRATHPDNILGKVFESVSAAVARKGPLRNPQAYINRAAHYAFYRDLKSRICQPHANTRFASPVDVVERSEEIERLRNALKNLSTTERRICLAWAGKEHGDQVITQLARSDGVSRQTVYNRLTRALKKLRHLMEAKP